MDETSELKILSRAMILANNMNVGFEIAHKELGSIIDAIDGLRAQVDALTAAPDAKGGE